MNKFTSTALIALVSWASAALSQGTSPATSTGSPGSVTPSSELEKAEPAKTIPSAATEKGAKPAVTTSKTSTAAPAKTVTRADRLDLETTLVTGNRELPKVLYIVPWKRAELGELPAQPFNTLLDEVLQPVDREVFKREVKYFQTVSGGTTGGKGTTPIAPTSVTPPATAP